jgi:peptide/nickel transport system substrate-binding protein
MKMSKYRKVKTVKPEAHVDRSTAGVRIILLVLVITMLAACRPPDDVDLPLDMDGSGTESADVEPTPEPPPPKTLFVCLRQEPDSLYIYNDLYFAGNSGVEANTILQAVYDGPIDIVDYQPTAVILDGLPNLARGEDARLEEVAVRSRELYFNPITLQPEVLAYGKEYLPSGCENTGCLETYQGGEVFMPRMVVDFHLLPDLTWSDGSPLTARDSVYSYELDRHADSPTIKYMVDRTHSYEALDDGLSVRWTGIPGFIDSEYQTNFWHPLPKHVLEGFSPEELLTADEANKMILGWGPYQIESWTAGQQMVVMANPNYFRASEGLPKFDQVVFRFLDAGGEAAVQQLLTGECDILDESLISDDELAALIDLEASGELSIISGAGLFHYRMDFNLSPIGQDFDKDLFADVRTRQAIAGCIDRESIAQDLFFGLTSISNSYLSPEHPAYEDDLDFVAYDADAAQAVLDGVGWVDADGLPETARIAQGVPGVSFGTPLSFSFTTISGGFEEALAEQIQADLAACGIEMTIESLDVLTFREEWPDGPIFGRSFYTVGWAWPDWWTPVCEMFAGREIPTDTYAFGSNAGGFNNAVYNAACETILLGAPETQYYQDAVRISQEVFAQELPSILLLQAPRIMASNPQTCGLDFIPLAVSGLWNIEVVDMGESCEADS